jgi:hypothetical protein
VSYRNGLYMTAGQHKGAMLRSLLHKTGTDIKAILSLDDHARHVRAVQDAFPPQSGIELRAYVFTRQAEKVAAFEEPAAKEAVTAQWDRLDQVIAEVFPSRAAGLFPLTPADFPIPDIDGFRRIHEIQGNTDASPLQGEEVVPQGVVTLLLRNKDQTQGFFIQDPLGDRDPATSEGLFVYRPGAAVAARDLVRVEGQAKEYFRLSEILPTEEPEVLAKERSLAPTPLRLPEAKDGDLEAVEGMLVLIEQPMTIARTYFLDRLGQATLSAPDGVGTPGPMYQPTQLHRPGSPEAVARADANRRRIGSRMTSRARRWICRAWRCGSGCGQTVTGDASKS